MTCVSFNFAIEILQFLAKFMLNLSQLGHFENWLNSEQNLIND
jgi:hypothetical protein